MQRPDKIDDLLSKLKPVIGEKQANSLWMMYHSERQKQYAESLIYLLSAKHLNETFEKKEILLSPIPKELAKGDYPLGTVLHGKKTLYPFGLMEEEWIHHVAIFGRSGSGKTMVAFNVLWNFLCKFKPFLIFDWKRNYRDLLSFSETIRVFTIGREPSFFFWNPLITPPGILPTTWIRKLSEILCHAYFLGEGVSYLLMKAIDAVFGEFDIHEDSMEYPTFKDVFLWINNYKSRGREAQWLDSTKRALAVLCYGEFGKALNVEKSIAIENLLEENVIIELDALTKADKTFFIEALLLWIHNYRLGQKARETFKHAILIEEAHHILLRKQQEQHGEETVTDVILREIRELGESIILIDQHPSLISKPAIGNTYTTIAMNLKHGADIDTLSSSLLLNPSELEYLGELPIGFAIVKLQGRWFKPFLVQFPHFPLIKGAVTDKDVKKRMAGYSGYLTLKMGDCSEPEAVRDIFGDERRNDFELNNLEERFLEAVMENPLSGTVEIYERLKINPYNGNRVKRNLLREGFLHESEISTKKGRIKPLHPTAKAIEHFGKAALGDRKIGNPGPEHEYWKKIVAGHYRKLGYDVEVEKHIGDGRFADIAARNENENIAIEIETGKSDAIYNIRKDIDAGFDRVVSVALNDESQKKIASALNFADVKIPSHVEVENIGSFLALQRRL